jgi:hypothetical protein
MPPSEFTNGEVSLFNIELDLSAFTKSPQQIERSQKFNAEHITDELLLEDEIEFELDTSTHFVSKTCATKAQDDDQVNPQSILQFDSKVDAISTGTKGLGVWRFDKRKRKICYTSLQGETFYGSEATKKSRYDKSSSHKTLRLEFKSMCRRAPAIEALKGGKPTKLFTALVDWGIPLKVSQKYSETGVNGLFTWQCDCLSLNNGQSIIAGRNLVYRYTLFYVNTLVMRKILHIALD